MIWQGFDRNTGKGRLYRTIEEYLTHQLGADYLELDLNGDGAPERITRHWKEIKGQTYTSMFLGIAETFEPITYDTLRAALGRANEDYPRSSFFLFEVVEFDSRPFVIVLETINPGIEWPDHFAYVLHFNAAMQPEVDCIMKTIVFGN